MSFAHEEEVCGSKKRSHTTENLCKDRLGGIKERHSRIGETGELALDRRRGQPALETNVEGLKVGR